LAPHCLEVMPETMKMAHAAPGDISYELSSIKERFAESFSVGSTVSGDSFINLHASSDEDDVKSNDPYLDGGNRRTMTSQQDNERSSTPTRLPSTAVHLDFSDSCSSSIDQPKDAIDLSMVHIEVPKQSQTQHVSTVADRSRISSELLKAQHERNYWNMIVSNRIHSHSAIHPSTAQALMQLGHSHSRCNEPNEALKVFKSAVRIFRKLYGENDLCVASALNKFGLVACRFPENKEYLILSMKALKQAFAIRYATLGPHHIDTVDSLNNIAGVYLQVQNYESARKAYYEVWMVRKELLGKYHPSVGVASQSLANVHLKMSQTSHASTFFRIAHDIFRRNHLAPENPTMIRLQADMIRLERIMTHNTKVEL